MGVITQDLEHNRGVGSRYIVPKELRVLEVKDVALHIFSNFVEKIARVTPPTATMKETCASSKIQ